MANVIQAGEFFVVGGPVQPERPCYVERAADQVLETSIRAQRFSFALGPRAIGKSSLMGRVIRALRGENELAAVVDLAPIDARGDSADANRWYYGIAHRIVQELRLKVDLQNWWLEKGVLGSEQRLAEFFWEIVLTNTTAPVTIFFDEIERAEGLPFSKGLFAAIRACYTRRALEPDYARLNFVVLGVTSPDRLCPNDRDSPFAHGQAIELADFDAAQAYQLAVGFGGEPAQAQALMDRICVWTSGHPYLTQKVARGVARKGGKLEDVERVVREQLLAPPAAHDEPLLNHIHSVLTERSARGRQALRLLRNLAKGAKVRAQPPRAGLAVLQLTGVVSIDHEQHLHYRNRIFKEAFGKRWTKAQRPAGLRIAAAAVLLLAVAGAAAFWYVEYLPRSYVQTLTAESEELAQVEAAYEKLRRLPGFALRADSLFAQALNRRSDRAATFAEAMAADAVLRGALDREVLADRLLADFWLRQSREAAHAERRDDALLYALQGLPSDDAQAALAELIGDDYPQLERTLEWPEAPEHWVVDWPQLEATGIDAVGNVQRLDLDPSFGRASPSEAISSDRITVLEYRPVTRELNVPDEGSAGAFELVVDIQHPASGELLLTLTAPSGAQANVVVPQREEALVFSFTAAAPSPLAALADEDRAGTWRVMLIDRRTNNIGTLLGWALQFDADSNLWRDELDGGIAIPDAVRTADVNVEISANGLYAIASPTKPGSAGALALWDLRKNELQSDVQLPAPARHTELSSDSTRLLIVAGDALIIWNVTDATLVARLATQTEFVLPPALAPEGDYVVIAERVENGAPLFSLLRAADGELLTSFEGIEGVRSWVLGPQARYLALLVAPGVVRMMNPRGGDEWPPLHHVRAVRKMTPLGGSESLLTVDAAGDIRVWRAGADAGAAATILGTTTDPLSVSVAAGSRRVAYATGGERVEVSDAIDVRRSKSLRLAPSGASTRTRLSPDGGTLLTATGTAFRFWRLNENEWPNSSEAGGVAMPDVAAVALDPESGLVAVGFRGGYVRAHEVDDLAVVPLQTDGLDFIGHRGSVRSVALNAAHGLIVSGGNDGAVRVWDAATMTPTGGTMRHPLGPVHAVDVSNDGRLIASAAESSVRLWRVADEILSSEILVDATAALALDFSADDRLLAVGDASGRVHLRSIANGEPVGQPHTLPYPVRWLSFSADGRSLFVATDHWLHRFAIAADQITIVASRLLTSGLEPLAALPDGQHVRLVGGLGSAQLSFPTLAIDSPASLPLDPSLMPPTRDWSEVLGRRVDASGEIVPSAR